MGEDNLQGRRSTRLSISIPVFISGMGSDGSFFNESVRTLIVNKHGAKIATSHHMAMGAEVLIENRALGVVAKANVVWMGGKPHDGELLHMGLQLLEAQNVWGIVFPPDDWSLDSQEEPAPTPDVPPASERVDAVNAEAHVPSLAGEEIAIRLLQELQESADAHTREFQDRMKQLTQRLGLELEFDLRERAAHVKAYDVGTLKDEIKVLREELRVSREEIKKLEARILEMQSGLPAAREIPPAPPAPVQDAQRHLTALTKSVVESMNRAAEAGLTEYRALLQKENQDSAAQLRAGAKIPPAPPGRQPPGA